MSITTIPSTARPIAMRMRGDLSFEQQHYQGQTFWVAKDPLSLRYFRLREREYVALNLLDGRINLDQFKTELEQRFTPLIVRYSDLQSLLAMLHQNGLVIAESEGQGEQIFKRRGQHRRRKMLGQLMSILWIRLPGVDPERFLGWLYPKFRWMYGGWCVGCCMLLALFALLTVTVHFDEFYRKLPAFHDFFGPGNALWLVVAMGFAKILHELGHGLTCKHFGGECHQIGLMFLVFTPALYCDTTDSWMLPNRWHRAAIGVGGMYVEVILASICTFIWWNTEPGFVHYFCLNMMFICSVSTILFNINPLLRFDGYYILSDILEIPNLAQKSKTALLGVLRKWCLGLPSKDQHALPLRQRLLLAIYAVASTSYRWMILIFVLWFLSKVFEPYGLQPIGHVLIATMLIGIVVVPGWKVFQFFHVPGRMRQVKKIRLMVTTATLTLLILAFVLVPLPHHVITTLIVHPLDAERVYVSMPGVLKTIEVKPGDRVTPDMKLATLKNTDMSLELTEVRGQRDRIEQRLSNQRRQQSSDAEIAQQIPHTSTALANLEERLDHLRSDQQRLSLVSTTAGIVMPPPEISETENRDDLPAWSGTPLEKRNLGSWMESGTMFCYVGDPQRLQAILVIDQTDMEFVRPNQRVAIAFDEFPSTTWLGKITKIAKIDVEIAPRELSNKAGGELATKTDASGGERPASASYQATVPLDNSTGRLLPGFRGTAKIKVGDRSLGQALWRYLLENLRFG